MNSSWKMFSTSKKEVSELLISIGSVTFGDNFIKLENYPFEPSIAFKKAVFKSEEIDDIDCKAYPPTIRIKEELIFVNRENISELERFATRNNVQAFERKNIWSWILEPFLDTEFTTETDRHLTTLLENYGLTPEQVNALRAEVEIQMLKYNFDTMLWEWVQFDASDVLRAMRTKYNKSEFADFYRRVMNIALLAPKTDNQRT